MDTRFIDKNLQDGYLQKALNFVKSKLSGEEHPELSDGFNSVPILG